ncbi:MAG: hypothetical protein KGN02_04575 [bacterium]|nr:hypothetical protein [bacterium]
MKYDSDDALDRALFALPLEEPPADLRAAILTATVYRPAPLFKPWELALIGTIVAIVLWLGALIVMGGGALFVESIEKLGVAVIRAFASTTTLAWLAAGGATAIWLSIFTGFQSSPKGALTQRR